MKKYSTCREKISLLSLFVFAALVAHATAQFDATPQSSSIFIDAQVNQVNAAVEQPPGEAQQQYQLLNKGFPQNGQPGKEVNPLNGQNWINSTLVIGYGFNAQVSKLGDGAEAKTNSVTASYLITYTPLALTLNTSLAWQNAYTENAAGNVGNANGIGLTINPAFDLIKILKKQTKREDIPVKLSASIIVGYAHLDQSSLTKKGYSLSPANAFTMQPTIVYTRAYKCKDGNILDVTMSPFYLMQWKDTGGATNASSQSGVFSLLGRLDYELKKAGPMNGFILEASATWSHNINQVVLPGQIARYQDWADFGAAIRYNIPDRKNPTVLGNNTDSNPAYVKVGYDHIAFRSDYYSNIASVTVSIPF